MCSMMLPTLLLTLFAPGLQAHLPANLPSAGLIMNQADALKAAFPAGFTRRTLFLAPEQTARAEALIGSKLPSSMIIAYSEEGTGARSALFDRAGAAQGSLTLMVLVKADGTLASTRILASDLPAAFLPPAAWLARLEGRSSRDLFWSSRDLSRHHEALAAAEAVFASIRRALAIYESALKG